MEIAALVISVVSALFTGWGVWYSRGLKQASDRAAGAAESSATAARETADIDKERRAEEIAQAERGRVVWSLTQSGKHRYQLTNLGTDSAYGVRVETGAVRADGNTSVDEFRAGHAEPYVIVQSLGDSTDRVTVTWHYLPDVSDEPHQRDLLL